MPFSPDAQFGKYKIKSLLGKGGMGEVYLAEDTMLGRPLALKLLPEDYTQDRSRLQRFEQEARSASALNHPNILTIYEIGEEQGAHFIATEFINGETLRRRLARAHLSLHEALDVAVQVAGALVAAHAAGIVHRDIKPENIMVRGDGYVKVLDFGLAKLTEQQALAPDTEAPTRALVNTDPGVVMGTVGYMSPEQARGLVVDARTDVWSLGVVLYEMIAGRLPFDGPTASDVISLILQKEPPKLANFSAEVTGEVELIVEKALTKDADERYQTAKDLLNDLKRVKRHLDVDAEIERTVTPEARTTAEGTASGAHAATQTGRQAARTSGVDGAQTVSSADVLAGEFRRHKAGVFAALFALLLVLGGAAYGLYRLLQREGAPQRFQTFKITRLTTSGKVSDAAISPDGRYVVHTVDEGGTRQSLWSGR